MEIGGWILIIIVILACNLFLASEFSQAAQDKGYGDTKYWWICFLLGIAGWILIAALPDRGRFAFTEKTDSEKTEDGETAATAKSDSEQWDLLKKFDWQFGCVYRTTVEKTISFGQTQFLIAAGAIRKQGEYYYPTDAGRDYLQI